MDEPVRAFLFTFDLDLWANSLYEYKQFGLVPKGSKVYLFPASSLQTLKSTVQSAFFSNSPEAMTMLGIDSSDEERPGRGEGLRESTVLVSENIYEEFLRRYVPGELPFGWVTWSTELKPQLVVGSIAITFVEIADGDMYEQRTHEFPDNFSMEVLLETLTSLLQGEKAQGSRVQERRFWNILGEFDMSRLIAVMEEGEKLKRMENAFLLEASETPMLQALQSFVILIEIRTLKKFRAILKDVNPFRPSLPVRDSRVGLKNLGNTCYMNCILQCLAHIPEFALYYTNTEFDRFTKPMNYSLGALVKEMYYKGNAVLDPEMVYSTLMDQMPQYRDSEQRDSEELFLNLLQCLITEESQVRSGEFSISLLEKYEGHATLIDHISRSFCMVSSLFTGVIKNEIKCCNCLEHTTRYDPFSSLPLILCPSRRYLVYLVYIDPARPAVRFFIDSPTPYEENESLLAIRNVVTDVKGISNFEIGELDSGFFNGPVGLTNMPSSNTLWVMQLPEFQENMLHIFCNFISNKKVLGTRMLLCHRDDLIQDMKMLIAKYLVSSGTSKFIDGGVFSQFQFAPVEESDIVEITESADLGFIVNSVPVNVEQILGEWDVVNLGQLAVLCDGVLRINASFTALPKICEKALTTFKLEKPVSIPKYKEKNITLTLMQLVEYTLLDKPQNEEDSFLCRACQETTQHFTGTHVELLPRLLAFPLQRARIEDGRVRKSMVRVVFPMKGLDLRKYEKGTNYSKAIYDLIAVVCHKGKETTSGHYLAYVLHPALSRWYKYNDADCKHVPETEVESAEGAYLLFYRRI